MPDSRITINVMPSEKRKPDTRFLKLKHQDLLFKPPFTLCVLGMIGSGKTSFVYSLLNDHYKNYFDECVVFCGTKDSNHAWEGMHQRKVVVFNEWDEEAFEGYFKDLEEENERRREEKLPELRSVVIFDDMIADGISKRGRSTSLEKCLLNTRHYNLSIILLSQSIKLLSRTMRINIMYYAVFKVNRSELIRIAEDNSGLLTEDEFLTMASDVLKTPYNYLIIDNRAPPARRFRSSLNDVIEL